MEELNQFLKEVMATAIKDHVNKCREKLTETVVASGYDPENIEIRHTLETIDDKMAVSLTAFDKLTGKQIPIYLTEEIKDGAS